MESRRTLLLAIIISLGFVLVVYAVKILLYAPEPAIPDTNAPGEVLIWQKGQPLP